jgi:hypothetical protein
MQIINAVGSAPVLLVMSAVTLAQLGTLPSQPRAGSVPPGWIWVADSWGFGRLSFGPHTDTQGRTFDALRFSFDTRAASDQRQQILASGISFQQAAREGKVFTGSWAVLKDVRFRDGRIEADICGTGERDFQGIIFRVDTSAIKSGQARAELFRGEQIYFRPAFVDEDRPEFEPVQYYARDEHPGRAFFAGAAAKPKIPKQDWFHVRIDVKGKVAQVFLDNAAHPCLTVELQSGQEEGAVGVWAWNGRLANLTVTPANRLPQ